MAARATALLLLAGSVWFGVSAGSGPDLDSERGKMELRRVLSLATQSQVGECWSRALEQLDTRCRDMTSESQSRMALRFTRCHLTSSGRYFPSCPEGSEVSRCTTEMDDVAFNAYTEFFTHAYSICHFLQSESWQNRAEASMYRLMETSAGVAEQLQSSRQVARDLMEAQRAALQAQRDILSTGDQLRDSLRDSTQGLQSMFSTLHSASQAQQVALSDLFHRVSFLQSFVLMEAHTLTSCCYNAAALCTAFLLTSTPRTSRARLLLLCLVCLNFYLEKKIYQFLTSPEEAEHLNMERLCVYVGVLRRSMTCVGVMVLLVVWIRYRDPVQQSLRVLEQLRETQIHLQVALQRAERLVQQKKSEEDDGRHVKRRRRETRNEDEEEEEEECSTLCSTVDSWSSSRVSHDASVLMSGSPPPSSPSSPLVYSVLVENKQPRRRLETR